MLFRRRNAFRFSLSKQFTSQSYFSRFTDMKKKWKMVMSCRVEAERKSCRKVAISKAEWDSSLATEASRAIGIKADRNSVPTSKAVLTTQSNVFAQNWTQVGSAGLVLLGGRGNIKPQSLETRTKSTSYILFFWITSGVQGLRQGVHDNLPLRGNCRSFPASPLTNLPPSYFPDFSFTPSSE